MSVAMSSGANYNPRNSESYLSEMSDSMDDSESEVVSFTNHKGGGAMVFQGSGQQYWVYSINYSFEPISYEC